MDILFNIAYLFAGFGLIIFGFDMLSTNLSLLHFGKLKNVFKFISNSIWKSSLAGFSFAAVLGDSNPVLLLYAVFLRSNVITLYTCVPAIIWANVGGGAILFITFLDMSLLIYFLIGFLSILYVYKNTRGVFSGSLLATSFLLLGIQLMKMGFKGVEQHIDIHSPSLIIDLFANSYLLLFVFGFLIKLFTQSLFVLIVLSISALNLHLLNFQQIEILFAAASFGGLVGFLLPAWRMKDQMRELFVTQAIYEGVRGILFLLIPFIEIMTHSSGFIFWLSFSPSVELNLIVFLLFYLFLPALILTIFIKSIFFLLEKIPVQDKVSFGQPVYIGQFPADIPELSILLVEKEQKRCFYLLPMAGEMIAQAAVEPHQLDVILEAFTSINHAIEHYLMQICLDPKNHTHLLPILRITFEQGYVDHLGHAYLNFIKSYNKILKHPEIVKISKKYYELIDDSFRNFIKYFDKRDEKLYKDLKEMVSNDVEAYTQSMKDSLESSGLPIEEKNIFFHFIVECEELILAIEETVTALFFYRLG